MEADLVYDDNEINNHDNAGNLDQYKQSLLDNSLEEAKKDSAESNTTNAINPTAAMTTDTRSGVAIP